MASNEERGEREREGHAGTAGVGAEMARALDDAARRLLERGDESVEHTLRLVVRGAIHTIPHAEQAGVSLVERGGRVTSRAPSNETVMELDELQNALGEGPCLDSIWHEQRTLIEDMAQAHDRWPRYAPAAQQRGIGSLLSFQLFATHGSAGALNLYASAPHVFDEASADTGALFAAQAALVLHGAKRVENLNVALDRRDVIGEAKGILVERFGASPDQAFSMLVESSQTTNIKLVDVARWLVDETQKKQGQSEG
jgi:transcriptional regulator with GAF, ATPase, and Fis domain